MYHLNIGQPDIETPENVLEKIRHMDLKVIEYSHSAGILSYRKKLVEYYQKVGIAVTPDEMIVTTGGSEGILFTLMVCLNPGDEIIIPEPFYANYNGFAVAAGVVVKPIGSVIDDGFALPPMSAFEEAINTPDSYLVKVLAEYVQRRNIVVESINRMEKCFCPNPGGAFYAVARLPIDDSDKFCQWLLEDFNFEGQTVMLAPATGFYSTPGRGKDEVRISYVLNLTDLKGAMTCLEEALKVYPGRK